MASKSLILALALATTAGAKGISGLNFGNYYDKVEESRKGSSEGDWPSSRCGRDAPGARTS